VKEDSAKESSAEKRKGMQCGTVVAHAGRPVQDISFGSILSRDLWLKKRLSPATNGVANHFKFYSPNRTTTALTSTIKPQQTHPTLGVTSPLLRCRTSLAGAFITKEKL
jgi:hypothetical protein